MWGTCVEVLNKLQTRVIEEWHQTHAGIVKTRVMVRSYLWWPNIDPEIEQVTKLCPSCQVARNAPAVSPLHPWM